MAGMAKSGPEPSSRTRTTSAVMLAKNLLYHMDGMTMETALEAGAQLNAITRMTEDCQRGVAGFLKK